MCWQAWPRVLRECLTGAKLKHSFIGLGLSGSGSLLAQGEVLAESFTRKLGRVARYLVILGLGGQTVPGLLPSLVSLNVDSAGLNEGQ